MFHEKLFRPFVISFIDGYRHLVAGNALFAFRVRLISDIRFLQNGGEQVHLRLALKSPKNRQYNNLPYARITSPPALESPYPIFFFPRFFFLSSSIFMFSSFLNLTILRISCSGKDASIGN